MAKRALPQLYCDENIKPAVVETFREQGFKCLLIAKTRQYVGRDEKDYIQEIYAEGKLFLTGDVEFVNYVLINNIRHAGILQIHPSWDNETAGSMAATLAELVKGQAQEYGTNSLRNVVLYIGEDGYHKVEKGMDTLLYSFDKLLIDLDTPDD